MGKRHTHQTYQNFEKSVKVFFKNFDCATTAKPRPMLAQIALLLLACAALCAANDYQYVIQTEEALLAEDKGKYRIDETVKKDCVRVSMPLYQSFFIFQKKIFKKKLFLQISILLF